MLVACRKQVQQVAIKMSNCCHCLAVGSLDRQILFFLSFENGPNRCHPVEFVYTDTHVHARRHAQEKIFRISFFCWSFARSTTPVN